VAKTSLIRCCLSYADLLDLRSFPTRALPISEGSLHRDGRFTGWGRAATDTAGRYAFTTVEPAPARAGAAAYFAVTVFARGLLDRDRKSTRLNSSHVKISYAVFCLKKRKKTHI